MPAGRPSIKTPELLDAIVERIAGGESVRTICRDEGMPDRSTVLRWLEADDEFAARCARARVHQADVMAERVLEVVDSTLEGTVDPAAARVAADNLKWLAAQMAPRRYGDKLGLEHTGPNGGPMQTNLVVTFGAND